MKREDFITWDEYFMGAAKLSSLRSKDNSTQVGACIVDKHKHIIGLGYNGMPIGCLDEEMPWEREGDFLETKYPFVCHAELNAISNATISVRDSTIYVTLFPCNECTKLIIQNGIKKVVYLEDKYANTDGVKASKLMLQKAGVKFVQYKENDKTKKDISFSV